MLAILSVPNSSPSKGFTKRGELLGAGNPDKVQSLNALVRDYKAKGKLAQADELLTG